MDSEILVALISLIGTLGGSLGGILVSSKMTAYRLQQLESRVAEHNNFARRTVSIGTWYFFSKVGLVYKYALGQLWK